MKRKTISIILLLAVCAGGVWFWQSNNSANEPTHPVATAPVNVNSTNDTPPTDNESTNDLSTKEEELEQNNNLMKNNQASASPSHAAHTTTNDNNSPKNNEVAIDSETVLQAQKLASDLTLVSTDISLSILTPNKLKNRLNNLGLTAATRLVGNPATGQRTQVTTNDQATGIQITAEYWQEKSRSQFARFYWSASKQLVTFQTQKALLERLIGSPKSSSPEKTMVEWDLGNGLTVWLRETTAAEPAFPANSIIVTQERDVGE